MTKHKSCQQHDLCPISAISLWNFEMGKKTINCTGNRAHFGGIIILKQVIFFREPVRYMHRTNKILIKYLYFLVRGAGLTIPRKLFNLSQRPFKLMQMPWNMKITNTNSLPFLTLPHPAFSSDSIPRCSTNTNCFM